MPVTDEYEYDEWIGMGVLLLIELELTSFRQLRMARTESPREHRASIQGLARQSIFKPSWSKVPADASMLFLL